MGLIEPHFPRDRHTSFEQTGDVFVSGLPREISGRQLLYDIRAGIDDFGLMAKYEVTKRQLKALLRQLADAGVLSSLQKLALDLSARELVNDIRAGLDLADLREKFAVSDEELHAVCEMFSRIGLLETGALEIPLACVPEPLPETDEHETAIAVDEPLEEPARIELPAPICHYFPDPVLVDLRRSPDEVKWLLENGMDPNARDRHHRRPALIWAAGYGNIDAVSILVDSGADLHATGKDARTALHYATAKNHAAVRDLLLSRGATA
jgi:ankyrin repeat protein